MSRVINTWRDPYDEGFSTCRKKQIEIQPGLTVLVGCNGAGKTTLLQNIKSELKDANIPYFSYNNLHQGGSNSISESIGSGNVSMAASMLCSSEGERISLNIAKIGNQLGKFIISGKAEDKYAKFRAEFFDEEEKEITSDERWILLDAVDSGFSIDNVIDLKEFCNFLFHLAEKQEKELYIIISSNEYELASGEQCFDVMSGKYVTFANYEEYKKFILASREKKDKRYK